VDLITLTARTGAAFHVAAGKAIRIVNTYGTQVVDTWALSTVDPRERMSMEHTRAALRKITPQVGDALYSNKRRVIATLVEDTSPGVHDTLIAACDQVRYAQLGHQGHHGNCQENYFSALSEVDVEVAPVPCPLNLFMNIPVGADGTVRFDPPVSEPGQYVTIRAEIDLIVVLSACPQDLVPVNGKNQRPTDVAVEIVPVAASRAAAV
jgi:uncharacterized protein YcgI (DUF1989 family)